MASKLRQAKRLAKDAESRMWSLAHPIGGRLWDVHATGAGQFWNYRLTDPTSGRALLLREHGPRRAGIYAEDDVPPAPEPLPEETALDWDALDPDILPAESITEDDGVVVIDDDDAAASADVTRWTVKAEWGSHDLWEMACGQPTSGPWQVQARAAAVEFRSVIRSLCWGASAAAFQPDQVFVTRIDLCADVWSPTGFALADLDRFRGRAIRRSARLMKAYRNGSGVNEPDDTETHESQGAFSGFTFGSSPLRLRLYDKTREIAAQSGKRWFHDLWESAIPGATFGVTPGSTPIWRAEAQIRRDAARALGIGRLSEAVAQPNLADAWTTITKDWLCLHTSDPYRRNQRRDRLPVDPRWQSIADAWGDGVPTYYARPIPRRDAERTARAAASTLASYAAAIQAPHAAAALAALAAEPEAETRYREVANDRLAEQIGTHAARHPALARAIGRAAIAALHLDAIDWTQAVDEMRRRLRKGNQIDAQFHSALAKAVRKG